MTYYVLIDYARSALNLEKIAQLSAEQFAQTCLDKSFSFSDLDSHEDFHESEHMKRFDYSQKYIGYFTKCDGIYQAYVDHETELRFADYIHRVD